MILCFTLFCLSSPSWTSKGYDSVARCAPRERLRTRQSFDSFSATATTSKRQDPWAAKLGLYGIAIFERDMQMIILVVNSAWSICQPNNSSRAETSCWSKQAKLASAILRHNHECFHVVRFALIRLYDAWDGFEPFKWLVQALHLNWTQFKMSPVRFLAATSDPVIVKLCTIQPRHSWFDDELMILINLMERTIFLLSINDLLLKFLPFFAK